MTTTTTPNHFGAGIKIACYSLLAATSVAFLLGCIGLATASAHLDGMRAGRTTMLLTSALGPVRGQPQASWSMGDQERVGAGFDAAMAEATQSVEALEWVERFATQVHLPARAAAAKLVRCSLEQHESAWVSVPRKVIRFRFGVQAPVPAC